MKIGIFFIFVSLILKIVAMEQPPSEATSLLRSSYTSLPARVATPPADIEQGESTEIKRRKQTLWNAINRKDVMLAKHALENDFSWVSTLYISQHYNTQISATEHEKLRHQAQFAHQLFKEIDAAIIKEEKRLEWLGKLTTPRLIGSESFNCGGETNRIFSLCYNFWDHLPQWTNLGLSALMLGAMAIYCSNHLPSRAPTNSPCEFLPSAQVAQMFQDCEKDSFQNRFPCEIFDRNNETQIKLLETCCNNWVTLFCMAQVDQYNDHVYPKKLLHAWVPEIVVGSGILAIQVAFIVGNYIYLRSKRSGEPIKQLIAQKKDDLAQIEQDLGKLTIVGDSQF